MLVLTRRIGEEIVVDDDIRISVVSIKGNRVQIGIQAPETVRVDQLETHHQRAAWRSSARLLNPDT
jgi:carbon storage regulator